MTLRQIQKMKEQWPQSIEPIERPIIDCKIESGLFFVEKPGKDYDRFHRNIAGTFWDRQESAFVCTDGKRLHTMRIGALPAELEALESGLYFIIYPNTRVDTEITILYRNKEKFPDYKKLLPNKKELLFTKGGRVNEHHSFIRKTMSYTLFNYQFLLDLQPEKRKWNVYKTRKWDHINPLFFESDNLSALIMPLEDPNEE